MKTTINTILDYCDKKNFHIDYFEGVIDAGIEDKPALAANWNDLSEKFSNFIENKMNVETLWSDEYARCDGCYKAVRVVCDSHFWQPEYLITDSCELFCNHCIEEEM